MCHGSLRSARAWLFTALAHLEVLKFNALHGAGMMCIISASREMGLDTSDLPLHIYGPAGLAEYLRCFLCLSLHPKGASQQSHAHTFMSWLHIRPMSRFLTCLEYGVPLQGVPDNLGHLRGHAYSGP